MMEVYNLLFFRFLFYLRYWNNGEWFLSGSALFSFDGRDHRFTFHFYSGYIDSWLGVEHCGGSDTPDSLVVLLLGVRYGGARLNEYF